MCRLTRPWFVVPDGCYALVTRFGKDMPYEGDNPVWPAGFYWGPPWYKVSNIVTKQSVVFNMPVKGCKTQDNGTPAAGRRATTASARPICLARESFT